ncbi:LysR substrate-binding domain-containing protein [Actinotalea sp. K2]|uniref:LysR family transcriptional regulator n=1 Tax=Actinotalea sp. K2 TaxID=2939438 RepID=UPI0020175C60|nr:LysR substrate-binding domain-containing protein [Actinotalea sp. K2]MCL3862877.1 LysR substrate-binding domain-containing protein [Actinotalea sp. K2]
MDVDLVALRSFVAVAEHLHFGRAAAALGISRRALSSAVVDLEDQLGTELFVRPSDRTELTDAGRALHARAVDLLAADARPASPSEARVLRIGIAPGVTVTKWTRVWAERRPDVPVEIVRTDPGTQGAGLHDGTLDVSFVRLPVDREGLSLIPLYSEVPVVVVPQDHPATVLDHVDVRDLVDEHLLQDTDALPQWREAAAALRTEPVRPLPAMRSTADAVALVAAGVGVLVVPQSVARLHARKDVTYREVSGIDPTHIAFAWPAERSTDLVEELIGILRGRTARSSRGSSGTGAAPEAAGAAPDGATSATPRPAAGTGTGSAGGRRSSARRATGSGQQRNRRRGGR